MQSIEGAHIGPSEGSCGAAAYSGLPVIVEDILSHPNWEKYRELARRHGLRACWSTPILSPHGAVLGTFAQYYRAPRLPSAAEREWVQAATHIAALAITQDSERRAAAHSRDRAHQLARLYAVSSHVNEAIARITETRQLYDTACRITVQHGLARLAWVGVYSAGGDQIELVAHCGEPKDYVEHVAAELGHHSLWVGASTDALRTGRAELLGAGARGAATCRSAAR